MVAALEINLTHLLYAWILVVGIAVAGILYLPPIITVSATNDPPRRETKAE
jgi:hypothetical protein